MKTIATSLLAALLILSNFSTSSACTAMMMKDANGNAYQARTMEWSGVLPEALHYLPAGSQVQSETPEGKQGMTFKTKYGFVGVSLKHMTPDAKQPGIAEEPTIRDFPFLSMLFSVPKHRRLIPTSVRFYQY